MAQPASLIAIRALQPARADALSEYIEANIKLPEGVSTLPGAAIRSASRPIGNPPVRRERREPPRPGQPGQRIQTPPQ
jgi:hypothetical protein